MVEQATAVGGDVLAVTGSGPEEVAELVVGSTKALGRSEALEAAHTSDPSFDAPVVLFQYLLIPVSVGVRG